MIHDRIHFRRLDQMCSIYSLDLCYSSLTNKSHPGYRTHPNTIHRNHLVLYRGSCSIKIIRVISSFGTIPANAVQKIKIEPSESSFKSSPSECSMYKKLHIFAKYYNIGLEFKDFIFLLYLTKIIYILYTFFCNQIFVN